MRLLHTGNEIFVDFVGMDFVLISYLGGSLFCSEQLWKPKSPCGELLSHMDFYYGETSDFPGCFISITRTGVEILTK
jgi:hypothetical protein